MKQYFSDSSLKKQIQLNSEIRHKTRGARLMKRQNSVCYAAMRSLLASGSPRPNRRQVVIPRITPKLVVKSKVDDFSGGTVSFR